VRRTWSAPDAGPSGAGVSDPADGGNARVRGADIGRAAVGDAPRAGANPAGASEAGASGADDSGTAATGPGAAVRAGATAGSGPAGPYGSPQGQTVSAGRPVGHVSDAGGADGPCADEMLLSAFDRLMPFHVLVGPDGRIERCGPTLDRMTGPGRLRGRALLSAFDLRRPRDAFTVEALGRSGGVPLRLVLRDGIHPPMRGLVVPLPDGRTLVNLSLGIALVEAVGRYRLTADDFAATDLAVEMLFLVEAQSAALHESRKLNGRLQGAKIAAEEQAFTDTLTGLKNRRAMTSVIERLIAARTEFALLLIDLDFFKDVNDRLGHAAGDHVLQAVARVLLDEARPGDTVVRLGGDEFALIAPGLHEASVALSLARRIVQRIEVPVVVGTDRCRVSASIGIALTDAHADVSMTDLLTRADEMLYAVKGAGRGDAAVAAPARSASVDPAHDSATSPAADPLAAGGPGPSDVAPPAGAPATGLGGKPAGPGAHRPSA